jgi:hypothetical protein
VTKSRTDSVAFFRQLQERFPGFHTLTPATAGGHVCLYFDAGYGSRGLPGDHVQNSQAVDGRIDKKSFVALSGFGIKFAKAPFLSILQTNVL